MFSSPIVLIIILVVLAVLLYRLYTNEERNGIKGIMSGVAMFGIIADVVRLIYLWTN